MVLRPVSDPRVVTRDGAALFGIDANCHEPLSQGGLPLRAMWHNGDTILIFGSSAVSGCYIAAFAVTWEIVET